MKLKLNRSLTALGAVLLGLAAQAQNPATPADHGGNGSTQTYPQGAPALRPDSLNNPNSTTNRGDKPNMTRKERRQLRRNRDTNRMERTNRSTSSQNTRTGQNDANTTTYPIEGNASTTPSGTGTPMKSTDAMSTGSSNAGNQNGNTGINTMGTATAGYTDTTSMNRTTTTGTAAGMGNTSSNAGNQNGNTGINAQGTSTSGYTGTTPGANTSRTTAGVASNIPDMRSMSIADFTSASPEYTVLVNALQTTEMTESLKGAGQFTVFAPSNSAFNKLPSRTRSNLLNGQNRETLKQLMAYHVVEGVLDSKEIARRMNEGNGKTRLQTLAGGTLTVEMGTNGRLKVTDDQGGVAYVETPDNVQSNGIVHGVDKVLLPKGITARFR
ncbi:hypothetical protein GCM10023189_21950 [Nibrella saemangeumensis]|uniref:FAS1 domain-containing protein n=1 Tax=Nibrella saemangeumensis TaxID=1084526 RepID=A0ABP8MU42_9BACT